MQGSINLTVNMINIEDVLRDSRINGDITPVLDCSQGRFNSGIASHPYQIVLRDGSISSQSNLTVGSGETPIVGILKW